MGEELAKKSGWGELGPKWITAIAALLTALTGAGFFLGRSTAPEDKSTPGPVTTTATAGNSPGTVVSSSTPPGPAATVFWSGSLEFGRFNLDVNPPIQTGDTFIAGGTGGVLESYHNAAKLSVWKSNGTPDKNACATTVAEDTKTYISDLLKGNHICGRTLQGRIFRFDVAAAGDDVSGEVTVWEK